MKAVAPLLAAAALLGLSSPSPAQTAPTVGDVVWAQWKPNDWYRGKVARKTDKGYHIDFDDGSKAVVSSSLIAIDKAPEKADVKVGARVVARWRADNRFYPGKVGKIIDEGFHIEFDDGSRSNVGIRGIRLISP
jgi:hypothetical protein